MAIKKKPLQSLKKSEPKKAAKPVAKKPAPAPPKKAAPAKALPAKKGSSKISTPVATKKPVSKPAAPASSKPAPAPAKTAPAAKAPVKVAAPAAKKPAAPVAAAPAAKKPATAPAPAKPAPVPAPSSIARQFAGKPDPKKPGFIQEVKNTSPVSVRPEPKKVAPAPAKPNKVVMPDIKTKTVRKYEPEFTKSVLDASQQDQTGPTMRYSDVELMEFRELITRKLDAAKKELAYLQGLITRRDEMGGDETDNRYMTMEDGSMSMEREQLSQMASRQITFIDHLEKAMMRIENKTYGICRVTGKLIDKARLKAVPHATLSIEAKQTMNK